MRWMMLGFALVISGMVAALGFVQEAAAKNYLCNQQFALCTSAPCVPQPGNSNVSICVCDVQEGPNLATVECDTVKPSTDAEGVRTVYSQFALTQFEGGKKALKCESGTPWSQCLNKICTVDPANPDKAICACDVVRTGEWQTAGGNCDTATCKTAYWSGALLADSRSNAEFMMEQLKIAKSPAEACPIPK